MTSEAIRTYWEPIYTHGSNRLPYLVSQFTTHYKQIRREERGYSKEGIKAKSHMMAGIPAGKEEAQTIISRQKSEEKGRTRQQHTSDVDGHKKLLFALTQSHVSLQPPHNSA